MRSRPSAGDTKMETSDDPKEDDLRPEYDLRQLRRVPPGKRRGARTDDLEKTNAFPRDDTNRGTHMTLSPQETKDFIARMDAALLPLFARCVVPIYGEHEGA